MSRLDVRSMPRICYRATDRTRPRWRCVLVLTNTSATDLTIGAVCIIQRDGRLRRQRTLSADALANCLAQGSTHLTTGAAAVLELREPVDTDVAATSLCIDILDDAPERHLLHREHVRLIAQDPRPLTFPLIGPWLAANARTDMHCLGVQFGFDFIKPGDLGFHEHPPERKMELTDFDSFGHDVLAPARGTVVAVENAQRDFPPTSAQVTFPEGPSSENREAFLGNLVVLQLDSGECVFMAHLQQGSVRVREGDRVEAGQVIACVGNSGNTSGPHLHIEMLDGNPDLSRAGSLQFEQSGLPFGFHAKRVDSDATPEACLVPDKNSIIAPL